MDRVYMAPDTHKKEYEQFLKMSKNGKGNEINAVISQTNLLIKNVDLQTVYRFIMINN